MQDQLLTVEAILPKEEGILDQPSFIDSLERRIVMAELMRVDERDHEAVAFYADGGSTFSAR